MNYPLAILLACIVSCTQHPVGTAPDTVDITIDAGKVRFKMAGGIGASWHAISEDSIDESPDYKWALRIPNSKGSAWGGNPPVTDTSAWNQICRHASW